MTEDQIRTALDGKFYYMDEQNRTLFDRVPIDYIPDHKAKWSFEAPEGDHWNKLRFTPEQDDTIIDLRNQGVAFTTIAKSMGRGQNSVMDRYIIVCRERGIDPLVQRIAPKGLPEEVRNQILALRRAGKKWVDIGKKLGISQWQASSCYHDFNRKRREAAA